jgi:nitrite reductase/ring-hydroxylating ferredoxin subunit
LKIIRFQAAEANLIELPSRSFFLHRNRAGAFVLIRARCPHRGGPLFLGRILDDPVESIRCPWHDSVVPVQAMQKKAPPMVVNGTECRVIVDDGSGDGRVRWVRTLLNESANGTRCHAACT